MAQDLLLQLHRRGVKLRLVDGKLDIRAAAGVLTPQLREDLALHRDALVALLERTAVGGERTGITPQPQERHRPFPLTDIQHAYWVGSNPAVELGGVATHYYFELDSEGLDPVRLATSLRQVIARHDMLRAVVDRDGRQRILPEVPDYELTVEDLRDGDPGGRLDAIRAEMGHQVLPPHRWPLFDLRLSRITDTAMRLHVSVNVLIIDAYSVGVFFHDWRAFYENPDWRPEPLALSYRDYVLAEERLREGPAYRAAEAYWAARLDELPPAPALPVLATSDTTRFSRRRASLPRERWAALKAIARRHGVTPSVAVMAAYAEVLRVWTAQQDFTLNLSLFNRQPLHPQIGEIIGDFTSVTLLAAVTEPDDTFLTRANRLGRQLISDLEHVSYSGVRVLREYARRTGGGRGAAMPVVFTSALVLGSDDSSAPDGRFFGEFAYGISQTPQVWLDHQVTEEQGALFLDWDAPEALFPPKLLDDAFAAYHALLDRLSRDASLWETTDALVDLPPWQLFERAVANDTSVGWPPSTLDLLVDCQAAKTPDATAVIADDGSYTYRDVVTRARRLAGRLGDLGAAKDTLIGVVVPKSRDQVPALLGIVGSGAAYLPVDAAWPEARRAALFEQAGVSVVVTTARLRAELAWPAHLTLVTLDDPEVTDADPTPLARRPAPTDLAYVIFTSGSTGQPKGVMIDHRGAVNTIRDITERFEIGPGDRVLGLSALSFDLSVFDVFGTLAAGATLVLPAADRIHDPAHWTDLVARHGVTVWNSVPALMQLWCDTGATSDTLCLAMLSGDWIPVSLPDRIRALHPAVDVVSLGGATEASIWSVVHRVGTVDPTWPSIPYGRPLSNQTMHVYDDRLRPCPVWTPGELYIGGTGVALGYWADKTRTDERFVTHPETGERLYRTGDLARYRPGGVLEFLGRNDNQVKLNGHRIELGEITATICRQPEVRDAVTVVVTNPGTGRRHLVAYVVGRETDLRGALEKLLPDHMVPHHYVFIDRIPLSGNGKVDPSALPSPWRETDGDAGRAGPRDDVERTLYTIWCETLGRDDFGVTDDFFDIGADSLHAVRILSRIREEFGIEPGADDGLAMLFDSPTVAELAVTVRALRES